MVTNKKCVLKKMKHTFSMQRALAFGRSLGDEVAWAAAPTHPIL